MNVSRSGRGKKLTLAAVLAWFMAYPLAALEQVDFDVQTDDPALVAQLQAASLVQNAHSEGVTDPREILAAALADYARLTEALYANGHYGSIVRIRIDGREAAAIPVFSVPNWIGTVTISVIPGTVFRFGSAQIAPLAPNTKLPADFRTGAPARSGVVQQALEAGVEGWRDAGHAKVSLSGQRITANHADQTLSALLRLDQGPQVRFGALRPIGASAVRHDRILRIAGLPTGSVYSPAALQQAATRLRRTGTFASVNLREAAALGPGNTLDIDLSLVDLKPRRFGFGAELSSLDGLTLSGFWLHRNLLGGAERFRVDGEVSGIGGQTSGIDYRLGARIEQPATFGPDTKAFAFAIAAYEDEPGYLSKNISLGAGASRIFGDTLEGEVGLALRYSETEDSLGSRSFFLLSLPTKATWDRRDNELNPTSGTYLRGEATPFVSLAGGGAGARLFGEGRAYRSLGTGDRFVLAGRVQAGSVLAANTGDIPPEFLFYSGGGNSVRGHPYQSLGIDLGGGTITGGQAFLGASAEVRATVTDTIGIVGFIDAAHIGATGFLDDSDNWHAGAGIGARYQTPIGPIRLDIAAPIAGDTGAGVQVYLGIGQAF